MPEPRLNLLIADDHPLLRLGIKAVLQDIPGVKSVDEAASGVEVMTKLGAKHYDCVLLDPHTRKCQAYAVRPRQCRTWPFWDSNVESPASWERTCHACPGSGQGKLCQLAEIESQRRVIRV